MDDGYMIATCLEIFGPVTSEATIESNYTRAIVFGESKTMRGFWTQDESKIVLYPKGSIWTIF
jgi:hypothetical protein